VADDACHGGAAEENVGSDEGRRPRRHSEPVLGQREDCENAERLRRGAGRVNDLLPQRLGSTGAPGLLVRGPSIRVRSASITSPEP